MQQKAPTPVPGRRPEARAAQTCPNCHALVQDGDIICVACGTNLLTGQKIAGGGKSVPQVERSRLFWIVASVIVVALLLMAVLFLAYAFTRDPVQHAMELAAANKEIEAGAILTNHLKKRPNDARALALMGKLDWKRGRFAEAADSFEKASEADRKNADPAMMAVLSLSSQGGADARERRINILKRIVQDFPDDLEAQYLLGLEQGAANDVDGEIQTLKKIIDKDPNNAEAALGLGIAEAIKGDFAGARPLLEKAGQHPDQSGDAAAALGFAAGLAAKPDAAIEELRSAVAGNTSAKSQALTRLGMLLVAQGRMEEGQPYLAEAVTANKDNLQAQFFHGVCLQGRGLTPEAINAFELAAAKQGPLASEALVRIGELQLLQGNPQKARDAIEKAEAAGVSTAALYTIRGRLHLALGEDDKARENFAKALKADSNYAPAHLENGLLQIKQQSIEEGVRELEKYLALIDPTQPGTRAAEVQAMVNHLKQAAGKQAAPAGDAAERSATS